MPRFTLSRRHALAAVVCAFAGVLLASRLFAPPSATEPVVSPAFPPAAEVEGAPTSPAASTEVVVDVAGAVRRPGVYRLPQGSRVADAVAKAGGATRKAEPSLVNLAAPLVDGQQVLMPAHGVTAGYPAAGADGASPKMPVSLSTATAEQLDALPGIGPVTAQKIVDYRREHGPFTSVDELDAIAGIGPARLETLRDLVVP